MKQTAADNIPEEAASQAATYANPSAGAAPPPGPSQSSDTQSSAASIPGAFTASTEQASYNSGDEFDYKGKADGAMYGGVGKSIASYAYLYASCRNVTIDPPSSTDSPPSHNMGDTWTTKLIQPMGSSATGSRSTR